MKFATDWKDFEVISTANGEKLEKWGDYTLLRPDPQVIWGTEKPLRSYKNISAIYERSSTGGGAWQYRKRVDEEFVIGWRDLKFKLKLMGFKHTGLFPEQAVNWSKMIDLIKKSGRKDIKVLNLFGYTGGATVACTSAGATVCHVDGARAMVDRCKENIKLSGLADKPIRYIVDDCFKFCERELRRGKTYDAIILDPPSFGRGPNGEKWKIEDGICDLAKLVGKLLSDKPLFVCLNSYTTGLQPAVMKNILTLSLPKGAVIESDEIGLPTRDGLVLPQGCTSFAIYK